MTKRISRVISTVLVSAFLLSGCAGSTGRENVDAGMEAIEAMDYA